MAYLHLKEADFDYDPDSIVILVKNLCNGLNTLPESLIANRIPVLCRNRE